MEIKNNTNGSINKKNRTKPIKEILNSTLFKSLIGFLIIIIPLFSLFIFCMIFPNMLPYPQGVAGLLVGFTTWWYLVIAGTFDFDWKFLFKIFVPACIIIEYIQIIIRIMYHFLL